MIMILSILVSILWLPWKGESLCASEIQLDILFGIDTSGSIGLSGFQIERDFLTTLVTQGVADGSRIGFTLFNTLINESQPIRAWDAAELLNYVNGLRWTGGYTNTRELIESALAEFQRTFSREREQIFMIFTDGNPCLPSDCPLSVCEFAESVKLSGIRTIIISVGDGLNTQYVSCLLQKDSDLIPVASFTPEDFNEINIVGSLNEVLCPLNKELKFTEIKTQKKSDITSSANGRWSRFVEIYNNGIDFSIDDILLTGFVAMAHGSGPAVTVTQGQYLVFYDASDPPPDSASFGHVSPSCNVCNPTECNLNTCGSTSSLWTGSCFCTNSVYVACSNSADGVTACNTHVSNLAGSTGQAAPLNGCSVCSFQSSTKTGWTVAVGDIDDQAIDSVTHGAEGYWITTDDGFSYELVAAGYDNSIGDNWAQSCSVLGTPGAPPFAQCSAQCSATSCGSGGSCNAATGFCDCDQTTGYYPQCTDPSSCTKCLLVPNSEICTVTWRKNDTDRFAEYVWSDSNRDGTTKYEITYLSEESGQPELLTATTQGELAVRVDNYATTNTATYGGFVRTVLDVCQGTGLDEVCEVFYSTATECELITQTPTTSPTPEPTQPPTGSPSPGPTQPPTLQCPLYYWNQEDVCERCVSSNDNCAYYGERCQCTTISNDYCCLNALENVLYDADRSHKTSDGCRLDVQWEEPRGHDDDWESDPTLGYLLSQGDHSFLVDVLAEDYPCTMDIFWALEFENVDCAYSNAGGNNQVACDPTSNDISQAGLALDVTSGWLTVWGADDVLNATVDFTVERLTCGDGGNDCYDSLAVNGELIIVNATSRCDPTCHDGRIYPMRIPVWYNYAAALLVVPSSEEPTHEPTGDGNDGDGPVGNVSGADGRVTYLGLMMLQVVGFVFLLVQ